MQRRDCSGFNRCARWCEVGGSAALRAWNARVSGADYMSGGRELGGCVCHPPDGSVCSPSTDCGCEPGTTCDYFIDERAFLCRLLDPSPVARHASCGSDQDCPALHACFGGTCKRLCASSDDCAVSGSVCIAATFSATEFPGWNFCTIPCDPVAPQIATDRLRTAWLGRLLPVALVAGTLHGYAYGESIVGAGANPVCLPARLLCGADSCGARRAWCLAMILRSEGCTPDRSNR